MVIVIVVCCCHVARLMLAAAVHLVVPCSFLSTIRLLVFVSVVDDLCSVAFGRERCGSQFALSRHAAALPVDW